MIPKSLRKCSWCGAKRGTKDWFGPCPNPECRESPRFHLINPSPKPAPYQAKPAAQCRQKVLLTGMDCLPGQKNLFNT